MTHRVVASIDFGTHGSGFAWAAVNERNREQTQRDVYFYEWEGQRAYLKNRSALLLDGDGALVAWGRKAEELWANENKGPANDRTYRTGFKMSLAQQLSDGHGQTAAGSGLLEDRASDSFHLIVLLLRQVYTRALEQITRTEVYTEDDVRWCVTVPAIWDEYTKEVMYKAAVEAGLPDDEDRLLLAIEPEAAALYAQVKGASILSEAGTRFMVVDAGGGTVDITSYEVTPGRKLSQLGKANGSKSGSEYLNRDFVDVVLADRLGRDFVYDTLGARAIELFRLVDLWEVAKRNVAVDSKLDMYVPLTASCYELLHKDGAALERLAGRQDGNNTAIVVPMPEVHELFDRTITGIMADVETQLGRMRAEANRSGGEVVLLVGGFAESPYLQSHLRTFLEERGATLHIPPAPSAAVMIGAAHFAYDPSVIRDRRSDLTYGVEVSQTFRDGVDPIARRFLDDDGRVLCRGRFDMYVANGDRVATDSRSTSEYIPTNGNQSTMHINIFATRGLSVEYVTDAGVDHVSSIEVDLSSCMHLPRVQRAVDVTMFFGQTRIRVEARNRHSGEKVETSIAWKPTW